jgi:hypothetical protein
LAELANTLATSRCVLAGWVLSGERNLAALVS